VAVRRSISERFGDADLLVEFGHFNAVGVQYLLVGVQGFTSCLARLTYRVFTLDTTLILLCLYLSLDERPEEVIIVFIQKRLAEFGVLNHELLSQVIELVLAV